MRQKTRILIYILVAIAVVIMGTLAMLNARQVDKPVSAQEHIDLGRIYLTELSYEKAVLEFTEAIEIEPLNADAYLGLAEAYVGIGDIPKAVEILEKGYDKTGDERLRDMLEELQPSEPEETIVMTTVAETVVDIEETTAETTANISHEDSLMDDIKKLHKQANDIYTAKQLTIKTTQAASMAASVDIESLYLPDYFFTDIDEEINFINYYSRQTGLIEIIGMINDSTHEYYTAYKTEQQPFDRKVLISGSVYKNGSNNIGLYVDDFTAYYGANYAIDMPLFYSLDIADLKYGVITSHNGKEYDIVSDNFYTSYISGDDFQGFYQNFRSEGKICDYFWTDISESSYTLYLIFSGTLNGKGNFNVIKCVVSLDYPDDFDTSLWDKIHEIDEVKSAINN